MNRETKTFEIKAPEIQDNYVKGHAAGIGNLDRGCDVIFPGFFSQKVLKDFLTSGFVAVGHKWDDLPVAMPTIASEEGQFLYTEAEFHSTQPAQDARTVCRERKEKGLSVGLSIGFSVDSDGFAYFDNGKQLLEYAKSSGYDMSLFDTKGISACKTTCRALLKCHELHEWSVVPVGMNQRALATDAKSGKPAMPKVFLKSTYLGDIERTTACGVIRSVLNALSMKIYRGLYSTDASVTSPDDLLKDLPEACDEARDMLQKTLPPLLKDLDIDELREQAREYYYYYDSAPPGEHKEITDDEAASEKKAAFSIPGTLREYEDFLRDVGKFSRKQAAHLAKHGWNDSLRDAGETETEPPATEPELDTVQSLAREIKIRQARRKLERVRLTVS